MTNPFTGQKPVNTSILNGLRGLAALYVLVGHARWLLWEGYSDGYKYHPALYSLPAKGMVYFLTFFGKGHIAVILFFVLSGFVIHYSTIKKENHKIDLKDYFKRRFLRIYPPLIFCMILTLVLDLTGRFLGYSIYFQHTPLASININVSDSLSLKTAAGNLLMLTKAYVPVWGTNGPLWSLMYEWWFYMLYPLAFIVYNKNKLVCYGLVLALFLLSLHGLFPNPLITMVCNYLLCWYLGAFLADILISRLNGKWLLVPLVLCTAEYFYQKHQLVTPSEAITDTLTGFIFLGVLYLLLKARNLFFLHNWLRKLDTLGDYSYTLYLIHVPILVFLNGMVLNSQDNRMPQTFIFMFAGIALSLVAAYGIHFLTEIPFRRKPQESKNLNQKNMEFRV